MENEISAGVARLRTMEHKTRTELAAGLRALNQQGQADLCAGFFAARHPVNSGWFYAARHGLYFEEVTPEDFLLFSVDKGELVLGKHTVDVPDAGVCESCEVCYEQDRHARPNAPVIPLCVGVFSKFPEVRAMIHAHGPNSMALASLPHPYNQVEACSEHSFMFFERVKYVSCNFFFDQKYIDEVCEAFRDYPETFALQARNHSYFMVGSSAISCWLRTHMFEEACKVQLKIMQALGGRPDGILMRPHVPSKAECEWHRSSYEGYIEATTGVRCPAYNGDLEFPGILRRLERLEPGWSALSNFQRPPGEVGYAEAVPRRSPLEPDGKRQRLT